MGKVRISGSSGGNKGTGMFVKWSDAQPGLTLEGTWLGTKDGKYGDLGEIRTPTSTIAFPMSWDLEDKLRHVEVGGEVTIVYLGKKTNPKTERSVHLFEVDADEESVLELDDDGKPVPF
jgi:hypothetical protein